MSNDLYLDFDKYLYVQNNFCLNLCNTIFEENGPHLYNKWIQTNNNLILFINRLDDLNKYKLFNWIKLNLDD
jgi:hypothetical protein